jgi:hypothetical protein
MKNASHLSHKFILLSFFMLYCIILKAQTYRVDTTVSGKQDRTNEAIIGGGPSVGMFDLDKNRLLHYNQYQGLYLGIGLHTNNRLSALFSLGGFWGYGFGSKSAAYGADGTVVIDRLSGTKLKLELSHDVSESGGLPDFGEVKRLLDPSTFYRLLVRRMDLQDLRQVTLSTGLVKDLRAGISFFQSVKKPTYDYAYVIGQEADLTVLDDQFHFTGLSLNFRYAFSKKLICDSCPKNSPGTTYPVVHLQFTRAADGWWGSEYAYTRFDLKVEQSFRTGIFGRTSLCLQAGAASGSIPYANLFDGRGTYGKFTIFAPQSFVTMRQNEFVSDRYASLYFMQEFGKMFPLTGYFNPELAWCVNAGFGDLAHPEKHRYIDIRTLTRGYFESGLLINNLLDLKVYNVGLGTFYRLGPYAFDTFSDNIAFKFSINFPL